MAGKAQSISYLLNKNLETDPFDALDKIVYNVKTRVTFWGKRIIEPQINSLKGSYSLPSLTIKTLVFANSMFDNDNLAPEKRLKGIDISWRIEGLYRESDALVRQRNFLTRFFVFLRDHLTVGHRYINLAKKQGYLVALFSAYSETQYIKTFGNEKNEESNKYTHEIQRFKNDKIVVDRKAIESLIIKA